MPRIALITGASGGLGEEFARLCAADGMDVILVARQQDKLNAIAAELATRYNVSATAIAQDLSEEGAGKKLADILKQRNLPVSVLINNAGFGAYGPFHKTDFDQEHRLLHVNIEALTELTKCLLPGMVERKYGHILNVASTAAFQPGPLMAVYYASKAYVLSFSMALSRELKGTGVTVTCLCPGPTKTGFAKGAHMEKSRLFRMGVKDACTVATIGYKACIQGKSLVIPGVRNKVGAFLTRLAPRSWAAYVAMQAQAPVKS